MGPRLPTWTSTIAKFLRELGAMGYKLQFVTLAGFHQLDFGMFELAPAYFDDGMAAYSRLQEAEFTAEEFGYTATRHQREVGTGYFDGVSQVITGGMPSTMALGESREACSGRGTTRVYIVLPALGSPPLSPVTVVSL